ncbi:structural maintenance of chromosomes protein 4-like [Ischnura elegans]|uniref:structural maintenance of chromosomes protein 4-like n=1 Tax=Ischnura elegans TaxID=197161 RepID=UPI001ED8A654|nr:structural maintenance of chromosomes protein 4-like [Ischnura elegans]
MEGKSFREYREPPRYDEDGSDASSEVKIIDVSNWDEEPQAEKAEDRIEHRGGGAEITSLYELLKKLDERFGKAEEKLDERFEKAEKARREGINKFERLEEKLDERFEKAEQARKEDIKKFEKLEGKLDEKFERIMKDMKERFDTEKDERGKLEGKLEAINGKIEGIGEIVDERVQEVKREVNEKVEVVREQVVIISRDVQEEKIHHEKRIKDLAEEVAGIRRMKKIFTSIRPVTELHEKTKFNMCLQNSREVQVSSGKQQVSPICTGRSNPASIFKLQAKSTFSYPVNRLDAKQKW